MAEAKTLSIGSSSDLVVKCPWAPGIIPADEPILPRTRLAITFGTLFQLRKRSHEALDRAFVDPIERLERIHSFRLAAEEDGLRLSVTYDFGWETYMRALHDEAGPFLDLLCCHCEGYPLARHAPPDLWQRWIRKNQVQSHYFYSATGLTVGDLATLSQAERVQREALCLFEADRKLAGFRSKSPMELAKENRKDKPEAAATQAIKVIFAMYRLTRYWTADIANSIIPQDAITLVRATQALIEHHYITEGSLGPEYETAFKSALAWYRQLKDESQLSVAPALPETQSQSSGVRSYEPADVQKGILTSFDKDESLGPITHGAAVFLAITDVPRARATLAGLKLANEAGEVSKDGVYRNLAFTHSGIERLELTPSILKSAPLALREGAAERAGSVGDVRSFHPSKWRPLRRNWGDNPDWEVELGQVHALVQLRVRKPGEPTDILHQAHPLRDAITELDGNGLAVLAVEGLAPAVAPGADTDHLGFSDGLSQPSLDAPKTEPWSDRVEEGDLLVGRRADPGHDFWKDGTFMAVRRMTIDRARFDKVLADNCRPELGDEKALAAKLLGRNRDGTRIGTADKGNNFVFDNDQDGAVCPLDSHIRRANPREKGTPRIVRRGMSFGPTVTAGEEKGIERGAFFIAYCADLAEQYERILGWVNGGNSTRIGSYLADPLSGVPEYRKRAFRFQEGGEVRRLMLPDLQEGPIGLSWSHYFFAPSLRAIRSLNDWAASPPDEEAELAERGRGLIEYLKKAGAGADAWRVILNEPGTHEVHLDQAIWAAIRSGTGILDTPAGYLVGSYDLVIDVLRDQGDRFSNTGAGARMEQTIGPFHLGMDPNTADYQLLSKPANDALRRVSEEDAFDLARRSAMAIIDKILDDAAGVGEPEPIIDLLGNLIEPVLAAIARPWFDIPDGDHVKAEPHDWTLPGKRKPAYPGDFWNASRYTFNPFLSAETERMAIIEGQAAVKAVTEYIGSVGRGGLQGSVSKRLAQDWNAYKTDEQLARVLVGCMIGGVPTVAINTVRLLVGGLENGDLERVQAVWLDPHRQRTFEVAHQVLGPEIAKFLQGQPIPELLWRKVARDGVQLGDQLLEKGRVVIFSLESAGRDRLAKGQDDPYIPFGMAPPDEGAQPPHGCPGRNMANGTIMGLVAGFLESARFRPGPRGMAEIRRP